LAARSLSCSVIYFHHLSACITVSLFLPSFSFIFAAAFNQLQELSTFPEFRFFAEAGIEV
jgi:hypothetical protein